MKDYKAGIYLRLSKEDSEVKKIVDDLKIRVDKLSSQINMQMNNTKLQHSNNNKVKDEKNISRSSLIIHEKYVLRNSWFLLQDDNEDRSDDTGIADEFNRMERRTQGDGRSH